MAALAEIVAPYEPERLVTVAEHSYDAAANWKILTENYHECYHCPAIHPELCRVRRRAAARTTRRAGRGSAAGCRCATVRRPCRSTGTAAACRYAACREMSPHRGLRRDLPERAAQPASGLRHDAPVRAPRGGPHADRVHVGVRARGGRAARVRPGLRRRLLGPDQPAGLGRLRVGAARAGLATRLPRTAGTGRGRRVRLRHHDRAGLPRPARHRGARSRRVSAFKRAWPGRGGSSGRR